MSGHARLQQLKKEGAEFVDIYVPDRKLTPKQEEAVIVRMNKNVAGTWDMDKHIKEFQVDDLINWGFSDQELILTNLDELEKENELNDDLNKKYLLEITFPNDMEMMETIGEISLIPKC